MICTQHIAVLLIISVLDVCVNLGQILRITLRYTALWLLSQKLVWACLFYLLCLSCTWNLSWDLSWNLSRLFQINEFNWHLHISWWLISLLSTIIKVLSSWKSSRWQIRGCLDRWAYLIRSIHRSRWLLLLLLIFFLFRLSFHSRMLNIVQYRISSNLHVSILADND